MVEWSLQGVKTALSTAKRPRSARLVMPVVLGVAGEMLLTAGLLVVLLLVWLLWWTDRSGGAAARDEVAQLHRQWAASSRSSSSVPSSRSTAREATPDVRQPASGKAFAVLHIPRFGSEWREPILQGTGAGNLRQGVGHYTGTAMPGVAGNMAIAGHRTTWGHPFGDVQRLRDGDPVVVETAAGWFIYRVSGHQVVPPGERSVLGAVPGVSRLTLTTCHPKYSARQRWVVHAELETSRARSGGPPPGLGL